MDFLLVRTEDSKNISWKFEILMAFLSVVPSWAHLCTSSDLDREEGGRGGRGGRGGQRRGREFDRHVSGTGRG